MKKYKFTYQNSGVNINAADNFVQYIANLNNKKRNAFNNNNIGSFASITAIPKGIKTSASLKQLMGLVQK